MARICGVIGSDGVGDGFFILSLGIEGGINVEHLARGHTRPDGKYNNITTPFGLFDILEHRHVNVAH